MKIGVVLPRGMEFSVKGATSIDLVVKDLVTHSKYRSQTRIYGPVVDEPFVDLGFVGIDGFSQKVRNAKFAKAISENVPDIIVVHQYGPTAYHLAKAFPTSQVVLHRHGLLKRPKHFASRLMKERQFRKIDRIAFVSKFIKEQFLEEYPAIKERCVVINNGVDIEFWQPYSDKISKITFAGRARQDKGILELVDAFLAAVIKGWSLELILAVQTNEEKRFFDQLQRQVRETSQIGLKKNLTSHEVRSCFAEAQVAALPSIVKEGFPRAVLEAMSCGCATIVTNSGGTKEAAGDSAIMLDACSVSAIKDVLKLLVNDLDSCRDWGQRARRHVVSNFSIQNISARYDAFLEELVS